MEDANVRNERCDGLDSEICYSRCFLFCSLETRDVFRNNILMNARSRIFVHFMLKMRRPRVYTSTSGKNDVKATFMV